MTLADGPIAVIRPLVMTMVACSIGALPVPSITRAPVNAITPGAGICAAERRRDQDHRDGRPRADALRTSALRTYFSTFQLFHFSTSLL